MRTVWIRRSRAARSRQLARQLLLVANNEIPDSVVQKLLAAILETSFSHLYEPPLDITQLSVLPEFPQHPGVTAYVNSKQPVTLEGISTASKLIALVTSAIPITLLILRAFGQWRIRDRVFNVNAYMGDLTDIEQEARELEPAPAERVQKLLEPGGPTPRFGAPEELHGRAQGR